MQTISSGIWYYLIIPEIVLQNLSDIHKGMPKYEKEDRMGNNNKFPPNAEPVFDQKGLFVPCSFQEKLYHKIKYAYHNLQKIF